MQGHHRTIIGYAEGGPSAFVAHHLKKLKLDSCVENIDYQTPRGIDQSVIRHLISCDWIRRHQNFIIAGPTDAGKSFLACVAKKARDGYRTFYIRSPKHYYENAVSKRDGSYGKMINKLAKTNIPLLDDLGLAPMTDPERKDLLEVVEDQYGNASTIITSQLPTENWHKHIGDPAIADAVLDRLIHKAHKINLKGGSMRKTNYILTYNVIKRKN